MSPRRTLVTARRVLLQLRHDPRSVAMIIGVPVLLMTLLKFMFDGQDMAFNAIAPMLLGIFPLTIMFLITSIATLRERKSGTLDRLMTQPIAKTDLVFGYAIAFSLVGLLQATIVSAYTIYILDASIASNYWLLLLSATTAAFLGTTFGLFVSAFARNEFQAVQLVMPIMMPQILLSGLFVPRDQMVSWLETISNFLPLTYAVEAIKDITVNETVTEDFWINISIVIGCGLVALFLGTSTIRRREK